MRERGNIWPLICVVFVALLVFVLPLLLRLKQTNGRMATVDAQVSINDFSSNRKSTGDPTLYRWPDGEVLRTAERLRDATAVAIAASTYAVGESLAGRAPHNPNEIVVGIAQRHLIPAEWLTTQSGALQTIHGTLHVRYSPHDLNVEVVSVPTHRPDGPAILIRVPDNENTGVGSRYFESIQLDGVVYPPPFAPIPDIIKAGWRERLFTQTPLSPQNAQ